MCKIWSDTLNRFLSINVTFLTNMWWQYFAAKKWKWNYRNGFFKAEPLVQRTALLCLSQNTRHSNTQSTSPNLISPVPPHADTIGVLAPGALKLKALCKLPVQLFWHILFLFLLEICSVPPSVCYRTSMGEESTGLWRKLADSIRKSLSSVDVC